MQHTILIFIIMVIALGIIFGIASIIAGYPCKYFVINMFKNANKDIEEYYFYYQKATAYRMLFSIYLFFGNIIKTVGFMSTFITVYCAIDKNDYVLLCSLISAMCQTITLNMPIDKNAKIYVEAARILEYELNAEHDDKKVIKQKLNEAYKKAEELISRDYI